MSEEISHSSIKVSSEKSFGVVFSIVFLILAFYPLFKNEQLQLWALVVSFGLLFLAFFAPKILTIPNKLWFKFGILLGSIIAPIVMTVIFFITVLPTGLIMRIFGKDLLKLKLDKNAKSYWEVRLEPMGSMKNQF